MKTCTKCGKEYEDFYIACPKCDLSHPDKNSSNLQDNNDEGIAEKSFGDMTKTEKVEASFELMISLGCRLFASFFWFFVYVVFVWYFDYRSSFEKMLGFFTLGLGVVVILFPKVVFGKRYYSYLLRSFVAAGVLFCVIL